MAQRGLDVRRRGRGVEALEPRCVLDSTVVFNELNYNPAGADESLEWIELYNQMSVDVDISGWRLEGGVEFTFPTPTVAPRGGFRVVAATPASVPAAGVQGPFANLSRLANDGEEVRLVTRDGVLMDAINYGDNEPWPVAADGSGATLAKVNPDGASDDAANWTTSSQTGGTPGARNFALFDPSPVTSTLVQSTGNWKYHDQGVDLGTAWREENYADGAWPQGAGPLYAGMNVGGGANTALVGYWNFNDNVNDQTATSINDGLLTGASYVADVPAATGSGKSLQFHGGSDHVRVPAHASLNSSTFTLAYWVKDPGQTTHLTSNGYNRLSGRTSYAFDTAVANAPGAGVPGNSRLKFYSASTGWVETGFATSPASWVHVAWVYGGGTLTMYVNGAAVHTQGASIAPAGDLYLGNVFTLNEGFVGLMDDVALWNVALSPGAVGQLASGATTPLTTIVPQVETTTVVSNTTAWRASTTSIDGGAAGTWNPAGNPPPPAAGTFTVTPTATSAAVIANINTAAATLSATGLVADTNVRYYRSTFTLNPFSSASATIRAAFDNGGQVYINGQLIATETSFLSENWVAPLPSVTIAAGGGVTTTKFDSAATSFTGWLPGQNEVIVAVRNPNSEVAPAGGFAFRMDVTVERIAGTTQLALGPTTYYVRTPFTFNADPARTTLSLTPLVDDGAVFYLNGVEVYRQNMPAGAVTYATLAASDIATATTSPAVTVSAASLHAGTNVLAVEVHQSSAASMDMLFAATLTATVTPTPPEEAVQLRFHEVSAAIATAGTWQVELTNAGSTNVDLAGHVLRSSNELRPAYVLGAGTLAPGGFVAITEGQLGYRPLDEEKLFLFNPPQTAVLDGVVVENRHRGRAAEFGSRWIYPSGATFGAANTFALNDDVVINEIMYHPRPIAANPGIPPTYDSTNLVAIDATTLWRYHQGNVNQGANWYQSTYTAGTGGWAEGPALLAWETAALPEPIRTTLLNPGTAGNFRQTIYFQTLFNVADPAAIDLLQLRHVIDDGAVFYINDTEVYRTGNMPGGTITFSTPATSGIGDATYVGPVSISKSALVPGMNRLSVEVHQSGVASSDIVFGTQLIANVQTSPGTGGTPFMESEEQWVEIVNRGATAVDLTGWEFGDGIDYDFAPGTMLGPGEHLVVAWNLPGMATLHPGVNAVGPFRGRLLRSGERIELRDGNGNPADIVRYYDRGKWHEHADGGGSSLELRDPAADNATAEAWAASDESGRSTWQSFTYSGVAAASSVGPDGQWQEFLLGLLGGGEFLLDDVRVVQNPATTPVQLIQNGTFEGDALGALPATWRLGGNHGSHGLSRVAVDPTNAANRVLHVIATGPSEHMFNHLETTLKNGATIATIANGTTYEISFRAKWLAGNDQLNARLYFNRLPKTVSLAAPQSGGTPGAVNSRRVANLGPTYADLSHAPAVPDPGQAVTVSVAASDANGVAEMTLFYRVANGAWQTGTMTLAGGRYAGTIPGQSAGNVVQFYVQGTDGLGAVSTYPAAGANSRALYQVDDGRARLGGANDSHNLRLVMTQTDADKLHAPIESLSNDRLGATVIYDERTVYYDVGVRLKGSERGRRQDVRISFSIDFQPDALFRGVQENIALDRSGAGDQYSQKEIIVKHVLTSAGNLAGSRDDLAHIITPRNTHTGSAMLLMSRHGDVYLDAAFENGSDGTLFEYELIYYPAGTTDGNPESPKLAYPSADGVVGVGFTDLGDDKERYRWPFLIKNNRDRDDYSGMIATAKLFALTGTPFHTQAASVIDADQWLRSFALGTLTGIGDSYFNGSQHNARFFARPEDGRVLFFPHDMDFAFSSGATSALVQSGDLSKLLTLPANQHHYYGHVHDIVTTTFNGPYITPWIDHYDSLLPAESLSSFAGYISSRAASALTQVNSAIAPIPFAITTANNTSVPSTVATITGTGWVNVRTLRLAGDPDALAVSWPTNNTWSVTIPVAFGANTVTLEAYDFQNNLLGTATITVTSTVSVRPLQDFLRVSELMYHPADPTAAELTAGFLDADEFEFVELYNTSATTTLDLSGVQLTGGVTYTFGNGVMLAPGAYLVLVENPAAFAARYPQAAAPTGTYSGRLGNGGETLTLTEPNGATILEFTYDDALPDWHPTTDGDGYSLVIINPAGERATWNQGAKWRPSFELSGSPGERDRMLGDFDADDDVDLSDLAYLQSRLGVASGATKFTGDVTGDGAVTRLDVARFATLHGRQYTMPPMPAPSASPASITIPHEPTKPSRTLTARRRPTERPLEARPAAVDEALATLTLPGRARLRQRR